MKKSAIFEKIRNHALGEALVGIYNQYKFRTEIALYKGKKLSKSDQSSIIHFSFNKAATQYTKSVLQQMSLKANMVAVDYNNYAFYTDKPFLDHLTEEAFQEYSYLFQPKGYLYSVFGGGILYIPDLHQYKVILMVRDPRDMLVSSYFSIKHSHPKPGKDSDKNQEFQKRRTLANEQDIDTFVLGNTAYYLREFEKYAQMIHRSPNIHITRYEDMLSDKQLWLNKLAEYCNLPNDFTPETTPAPSGNEDIKSHNRKGIAGDYREKLQPDTISELNRIFGKYLIQYGYAQ